MTRRTLILAVAAALAGCTKEAAPLVVKSEVPGVADEAVLPLGTGYLGALADFVGEEPCVTSSTTEDNHPVFLPAWSPEGTLKAGYAETQDVSEDRFTAGAEVQGSVGIMGVSLDARGRIQVSTALVDSDLKTSAFITFTNRAGNVVLLDPVLSDHGKLKVLLEDPVDRLFACGDEFVHQIQLGARLSLGLEFAFASKEIKNDFSLRVSGSAKLGEVEISETFLDVDDDFDVGRIKGSVRVVFEQEGGDPAAFEARKNRLPRDCFVAGKVEGPIDARKAFLEGYERCVAAYRDLVTNYAAKEFPAQMKGLDAAAKGDPRAAGYTALRYYTMPYERAGYRDFRADAVDVPASVREFFDRDLRGFIATFRQFAGNVAAVESILANTGDGDTIQAVRESLRHATGSDDAQLHQLVADAVVLRGRARVALSDCRIRLRGGIRAGSTAEALDTCREDLLAVERDMKSVITRTGGS